MYASLIKKKNKNDMYIKEFECCGLIIPMLQYFETSLMSFHESVKCIFCSHQTAVNLSGIYTYRISS